MKGFRQDPVSLSDITRTFIHELKHYSGVVPVVQRQLGPQVDEVVVRHVCSRFWKRVLGLTNDGTIPPGVVVLQATMSVPQHKRDETGAYNVYYSHAIVASDCLDELVQSGQSSLIERTR